MFSSPEDSGNPGCLGCGVPTEENPQYDGVFFVGYLCPDCLKYAKRKGYIDDV
jgi:hypothetical protein